MEYSSKDTSIFWLNSRPFWLHGVLGTGGFATVFKVEMLVPKGFRAGRDGNGDLIFNEGGFVAVDRDRDAWGVVEDGFVAVDRDRDAWGAVLEDRRSVAVDRDRDPRGAVFNDDGCVAVDRDPRGARAVFNGDGREVQFSTATLSQRPSGGLAGSTRQGQLLDAAPTPTQTNSAPTDDDQHPLSTPTNVERSSNDDQHKQTVRQLSETAPKSMSYFRGSRAEEGSGGSRDSERGGRCRGSRDSERGGRWSSRARRSSGGPGTGRTPLARPPPPPQDQHDDPAGRRADPVAEVDAPNFPIAHAPIVEGGLVGNNSVSPGDSTIILEDTRPVFVDSTDQQPSGSDEDEDDTLFAVSADNPLYGSGAFFALKVQGAKNKHQLDEFATEVDNFQALRGCGSVVQIRDYTLMRETLHLVILMELGACDLSVFLKKFRYTFSVLEVGSVLWSSGEVAMWGVAMWGGRWGAVIEERG